MNLVYASTKPAPEDPEQPLKRYYLLADADEGSLQDWSNFKQHNGKQWTEDELLGVLGELLKQLQVLYESGIVSRNIKPEHLAFVGEKIRVLDFSYAHLVNEDTSRKLGVVGSPEYLAPELKRAYEKMLSRCEYDPVKTEAYSAARTILKLAVPDASSTNDLTSKTQERYPRVYETLKSMLIEDPNERVGFLDLKTEIALKIEENQEEPKKGKKLFTEQERQELKQYLVSRQDTNHSTEELLELLVVYSQIGAYKTLKTVLEKVGPKTDVFKGLALEDQIRIFDAIGDMASAEENYVEAEEAYTNGLKLKEELCGKGHASILGTLTLLSRISLKSQNLNKAVEYYETVLELRKKEEEGTPELAFYYQEVALLYEKANGFAKARECYESALKIYQGIYGENDSRLANLYSSIGNVQDKLGFYNEALENLELALKLKLKTVPSDHPSLAANYNNLGLAYERISKGKKALKNYKIALDIWLKAGEQSENVATAYNNIGSAYDNLKDQKQAVEYYEKALEMRIKLFGPEHASIAQIYNNLGTAYFHLSQYPKALDNYKKCAEIWIRSYGEESNLVGTVYNNMANTYTSLKDKSEAKKYFTKCVEVKGKVLGKSHPSLATTYANLGVIYLEDNDKEKAVEYLELAHEIRNEQLGKTHPATVDVYNLLVKVRKSITK